MSKLELLLAFRSCARAGQVGRVDAFPLAVVRSPISSSELEAADEDEDGFVTCFGIGMPQDPPAEITPKATS